MLYKTARRSLFLFLYICKSKQKRPNVSAQLPTILAREHMKLDRILQQHATCGSWVLSGDDGAKVLLGICVLFGVWIAFCVRVVLDKCCSPGTAWQMGV